MPAGRPSTYDPELADRICEGLADGRSLRSICLEDDMPSQTTVFRWLADERYAAFREQYARARETQADALFDEILDIADNAVNDWMERSEEKGGGWELNGEHVRRTQLRIDARKWMASKMLPKKYGDSTQLRHADADGGKLDFAGELLKRRKRADGE